MPVRGPGVRATAAWPGVCSRARAANRRARAAQGPTRGQARARAQGREAGPTQQEGTRAGATMEQSPGATVEESLVATMEERGSPGANVEESLGATVEESLVATMEERGSSGATVEESSGATVEESPGATVEESPRATVEESPRATVEESPGVTKEEITGVIMKERSGSGFTMMGSPGVTMEKSPGVIMEKIPGVTMEGNPGAGFTMAEIPADTMEETPGVPIEVGLWAEVTIEESHGAGFSMEEIPGAGVTMAERAGDTMVESPMAGVMVEESPGAGVTIEEGDLGADVLDDGPIAMVIMAELPGAGVVTEEGDLRVGVEIPEDGVLEEGHLSSIMEEGGPRAFVIMVDLRADKGPGSCVMDDSPLPGVMEDEESLKANIFENMRGPSIGVIMKGRDPRMDEEGPLSDVMEKASRAGVNMKERDQVASVVEGVGTRAGVMEDGGPKAGEQKGGVWAGAMNGGCRRAVFMGEEVGTRADVTGEEEGCLYMGDSSSAFVMGEEGSKAGDIGEEEVGLIASAMDEGPSVAVVGEGENPKVVVGEEAGLDATLCEKSGLGACLGEEAGLSDNVRQEAGLGTCTKSNERSNCHMEETTACIIHETAISDCITEEAILQNDLMLKGGSKACAVEVINLTTCLGVARSCDHVMMDTGCRANGEIESRAGHTVEAAHGFVQRQNISKAGRVRRASSRVMDHLASSGMSGHKIYLSEEEHENEPSGCCCICSDDHSWPNNLLVYCDGGSACQVAVHQACYGIVKVPEGPWFCRKCESQERAAKVKCELCPEKVGALKRTDNGGWAHVICALYIPEVSFACTTTMEPILLKSVPRDRFTKVCYICTIEGRESKGACMTCNVARCSKAFHATCAQSEGLLCEEAGTGSEELKYCGYCKDHFIQPKPNAENGEMVPLSRKNVGNKKKCKGHDKRSKEQCKSGRGLTCPTVPPPKNNFPWREVCQSHAGITNNADSRSFKHNQGNACLSVYSKSTSAPSMNEAVEVTMPVCKRKRKATGLMAEQQGQTEGRIINTGKKLKHATCAMDEDAILGKKRKVEKKEPKKSKLLMGRHSALSRLPVSTVIPCTSYVKGAGIHNLLPKMTIKDSQNLKDAIVEKSLKRDPNIGRSHSQCTNGKSLHKIFCGKSRIRKSLSPKVMIANMHLSSAAVPNSKRSHSLCVEIIEGQKSSTVVPTAGKLQSTLVKSSNLQKSSSVPRSRSVVPRKRRPHSTCAGVTQHNSSPAIPKTVTKENPNVKGASKLKSQPSLLKTVNLECKSVKGIKLQKVTPALHLTVSKKKNSVKVAKVQKSPATSPKFVDLKAASVKAPNLQKLPPANSNCAHLQDKSLHSGKLTTFPTVSKTDCLQDLMVNANNPQTTSSIVCKSGNSPAQSVVSPIASGFSFGDSSCKHVFGDLTSRCLLTQDIFSVRSPGASGMIMCNEKVNRHSEGCIQDHVSLEQLLERQWSEGHEFLLEHGAFTDIMETLKSLNQLQMENEQLEKKISRLTAEKERLQLAQFQLSFPFPSRASNLTSSPHAVSLSAHGGSQGKK